MRIDEILIETIKPEEIDSVSKMQDIHSAREATIRIMFANATPAERRADLRASVMRAGSAKQLAQLLWNMKLSNEGLPTGTKTARTSRGIGYAR